MAITRGAWSYKLGLAGALAIAGTLADLSVGTIVSLRDHASAQIEPDTTLERSSVVTPRKIRGLPGNQITGGTTRGTNLFHSFRDFNIDRGLATYFGNPPGIENIFSRVTGDNRSDIQGTLGVLGNANLFLMNPNGIIFGRNASLDLRGSFMASSATRLNFADNTQFSTTAPEANTLLSLSVPVGLQFGSAPGTIVNRSKAPNRSGFPVGLQVRQGNILALVGGKVRLEGGSIQAPGGRVELGGVAGPGTVDLTVDSRNLNLRFPNRVQRADVALTDGSRVNVRAGNRGDITINAQSLAILEGSNLQAGIRQGQGGAESQAGDVTLNLTEAVTIAGNDSSITNYLRPKAAGTSGNVNITAGSLSVTNGAVLSASTFGNGDAGNVTIDARGRVSLDGVGSNGKSSEIATRVGKIATGKGGNINITAGSLSVTNGAVLSASTFGNGDAGNMIIGAREQVSLDGVGSNEAASRAASAVGETATGKGGSITIKTGSLWVTNGARLSARSEGQGDAGNVTVRARDTVSFNGMSEEFPSAAFSSVEAGAEGSGGDITITARLFSVTEGAGLTTSSQGQGAAGDIGAEANLIRIDDNAFLSSNTVAGQGNVTLDAQTLLLSRGSTITTDAQGTATGGNIAIDTDVLAVLESNISANAQEALGGQVRINAQGIFRSSDSDITATSDQGPEFSGTVEINTSDIDPDQGLVALPEDVIDASRLIAQGCSTDVGPADSKFVLTGRGGLPPAPRETVSSDTILEDWGNPLWARQPQSLERSVGSLPHDQSIDRPSNRPIDPTPGSNSAPIVEAQGWVTNPRGEVMLTAQAPTVAPHSARPSTPNCLAAP